METVSVIIPVYNSERTIVDVLESVYSQSAVGRIIEIIIVDDGSKDNSENLIQDSIINHPDINIIYLRQENAGVSAARNKGMKLAKGDYIAFLDSDDLWFPNKIQRQLEVFNENPEIVFLGTGHVLGKDTKEAPLFIRGRRILGLHKATLHDIYWKHFPATPSVMFRRNAINQLGYFDESQKYGEDINYFQKFCIHFNYYYLAEPLLHVDYNKSYFGSQGLSSNFKGMHEGDIKNLRELRDGGYFTSIEYIKYRIFFQMKYIRRILFRNYNKLVRYVNF